MKKAFYTLALLFGSTYLNSQEIDLNQLKKKDREALEKEKITGIFKKNSLVVDLFAFSNFERFIAHPEQRITNQYGSVLKIIHPDFDFNPPFGAQIEFFASSNWGIGLNFRYGSLSYQFKDLDWQFFRSEKFTTLNTQFATNYHLPTGFNKADIYIGLGLGMYKQTWSLKQTFQTENSSSSDKYLAFSYSFRSGYRFIITKRFGVNCNIGVELYQHPKYWKPFPEVGQITIGNIRFNVTPSASVGVSYKIL